MSDFPPLMRDQRPIDDDHLRLTASLHFAMAGLATLAIVGLVVHYFMVRHYLSTPELWRIVPEAQPEHVILVLLEFASAFVAFVLVGIATLNIASGMFIRQRKHRMLSLTVAALNSLLVPIGTVVAGYTFVVLMRDSVRDVYLDD
jgi:hypothetical protein